MGARPEVGDLMVGWQNRVPAMDVACESRANKRRAGAANQAKVYPNP
jgi:hypothetical protein